MGVFTDRSKLLTFSRRRAAYAIACVAAFLLTELGRFVYRPYIYRNGIDDFGIADTVGNSLGVVTQIFCMMAVLHPSWTQSVRIILFVTCGYIVYEFAQPVLPRGTFDPNDVIATLVGGAIAFGMLALIRRLVGDPASGGDSTPKSDRRQSSAP